jgi:hypothetical protein
MKLLFQNVTPGILLPFQTCANQLETLTCYAVTFREPFWTSGACHARLRALLPFLRPFRRLRRCRFAAISVFLCSFVFSRGHSSAFVFEVQHRNILSESIDHQAVPLLHPGNSEVQHLPHILWFTIRLMPARNPCSPRLPVALPPAVKTPPLFVPCYLLFNFGFPVLSPFAFIRVCLRRCRFAVESRPKIICHRTDFPARSPIVAIIL